MNEAQQDLYLRHTQDFKPRIGFTSLDESQATAGPSLNRTFERLPDPREEIMHVFKRDPEEILCKGAACGLDAEGIARHFQLGLGFLGFVERNVERYSSLITDGVCVKTRGAVNLKVEGATDEHRGKPVFCSGPNDFSLEKQRGAAEIGKIRYFQNGRASVAFRRFDDNRPLNLSLL